MKRSTLLRAVATAVLLAGCGQQVQAASDGPSVSATDDRAPSAAGPTWPPAGCSSMSSGSYDFASPVTGGAPTPEQAALDHVPAGTSVVHAPPPGPHRQRLWWVLDDSGAAVAAVGVARGSDGTWLVDFDERCAD